ncbi:hypothetical protein M405DRAFT_866374 [Rhizopogon salebrosus TDB-379]|nr:hypothetical protein M405DRAFT_866374 [Rhizopogon salebrosus TDB-379]
MSSSTQDLLPSVDLRNTFGAIFIGAVFAAILFGLSNVQAFIYFQTHRGTGITLFKLVVIGLWALDAFHLALVIHCIYYYLVTDYANFDALTEVVWSGKLQIVLAMFTVWVIHFMYAYRIWIVSKGRSRALPIIVYIIVILALGAAIVVAFEVYQCHLFSDFVGMEWATLMDLGLIAFIDFVIASSLCYFLATSRTGFSSTDTFLTKIMGYTINTGSLTSIVSLVACITCAVMPNNFIYMAVEFSVAKLYVNSFLALLNAPYYLQPNTGTDEFRIHHSAQRLKDSQDDKLQASRVSGTKHSQDEETRPTCPVQAVMPQRSVTVVMEMSSSSDLSV